jgi:hypothetical protein
VHLHVIPYDKWEMDDQMIPDWGGFRTYLSVRRDDEGSESALTTVYGPDRPTGTGKVLGQLPTAERQPE